MVRSVLILILSLCCADAAASQAQDSFIYLFFDRVSGQKVVLNSPVPRGDLYGHLSDGASMDSIWVAVGADRTLETLHVVDTVLSKYEPGTVALVLQGGSLFVLDEVIDQHEAALISPATAAVLYSRFGHGHRGSVEFERNLREIGQPLDSVEASEALIEAQFKFVSATFEPMSFEDMVDCEDALRADKADPSSL